MRNYKPQLSIIIPSYNEEAFLGRLLVQLERIPFSTEIIVADGGSIDRTIAIATQYNCTVLNTEKGRSLQMAAAAEKAKAPYLLFLHADVAFGSSNLSFLEDLIHRGVRLASFRLVFDWSHWFLKLNAFFSRFVHPYFYFGDQGLWIEKGLYDSVGGFDTSDCILEDQSIYKKASSKSKAIKLKQVLIVSSRKYREYGVYQLQFLFYKLWFMAKIGYSKKKLCEHYEAWLTAKRPSDT